MGPWGFTVIWHWKRMASYFSYYFVFFNCRDILFWTVCAKPSTPIWRWEWQQCIHLTKQPKTRTNISHVTMSSKDRKVLEAKRRDTCASNTKSSWDLYTNLHLACNWHCLSRFRLFHQNSLNPKTHFSVKLSWKQLHSRIKVVSEN